MTKSKDFLNRLKLINDEIVRSLQKREELYQSAISNSVSNYSGMPKTHSVKSPFEDAINKVVELDKRIDELQDQFSDVVDEIYNVIIRLPQKSQREVIELRYVEFASWKNISNHIGKSIRAVHYIHGQALEAVNKILSQDAV